MNHSLVDNNTAALLLKIGEVASTNSAHILNTMRLETVEWMAAVVVDVEREGGP